MGNFREKQNTGRQLGGGLASSSIVCTDKKERTREGEKETDRHRDQHADIQTHIDIQRRTESLSDKRTTPILMSYYYSSEYKL